jgi:hypothetical protein
MDRKINEFLNEDQKVKYKALNKKRATKKSEEIGNYFSTKEVHLKV